MKEIKTIGQARQAGKEFGQEMNARDERLEFDFKDLAASIKDAGVNDFDTDTLAALLALPDNQFRILAPVFLDALEGEYNKTNNQLLMLRTLNLTGQTYEDIREEYQALCDELDSTMENVSAIKISFMKEMIGLFYNSISEIDGVEKCILNVPVEVCRQDVRLPEYAHLTDSGMDVFALEDVTINPGETKIIPTGIKVRIPKGYEIQVRDKSGRALKTKLRVANAPGTIDCGYRDEIGVIIENIEPFIRHADIDENGRLYNVEFGSSYTIERGQKFAQLVLAKVPKIAWVPVESVADSEDRGGGFGSTGLN